MKRLFSAVCVFLALPSICADLTVVVTNVKKTEGTLRLVVVEKENFANNDASEFVATKQLPASSAENAEARFTLTNLPKGEFAVQIHHDVNNNEKMDKNLVGMPKEPYGFSRDAPVRMGPPKWDAAKIELTDDPMNIRIKLR